MGTDNCKKHYVLVHGACHGAWSWYKLKPRLESAGNKVTALDLAASGTNLKKIEEVDTVAQYSEPLFEFLASLPQDEKVVLVGHSLGGINIALAMDKFPEKVEVGIFLTAFVPDTQRQPSYVLEKVMARNLFCVEMRPLNNGVWHIEGNRATYEGDVEIIFRHPSPLARFRPCRVRVPMIYTMHIPPAFIHQNNPPPPINRRVRRRTNLVPPSTPSRTETIFGENSTRPSPSRQVRFAPSPPRRDEDEGNSTPEEDPVEPDYDEE